jgi:DeoR/GlpR family transcriptional regulator of sugar metabolism
LVQPARLNQQKGVTGKTDMTSEKMSGETSGKMLDEIRQNSEITIPKLAELLGVTPRTVERNIQKLQKSGYLRRVGAAKGGYWEVADTKEN